MRRFMVAAGMGTMVLLGPAAPAMAEQAAAAQPQTQTVAVADQTVQKQEHSTPRDDGGGGGKGNAGLWGLLGLLGLLGFAGMRKPKAHHHDVGVSERPSAPGR
jgi:MYXO-CTERM domain-containing protein